MGINDKRFLFVLDVIFQNLLDESMNHVFVMQNKSIGIYHSSGFSEYLLFIQNNETELCQTGHFTTDAYNALQCIHVFLKKSQQIREKVKTLWIQVL